jgi:hypothetical protein
VSLTTTLAVSAIPCFYFFLRNWLTGHTTKLGFYPAVALFMVLYCAGLFYGLLAGKVSLELIKRVVNAPFLVLGVAGNLDPATTAKIAFGVDKMTASDKMFITFMSMAMAMYAALTYTLVDGGTIVEAMRHLMDGRVVSCRFKI